MLEAWWREVRKLALPWDTLPLINSCWTWNFSLTFWLLLFVDWDDLWHFTTFQRLSCFHHRLLVRLRHYDISIRHCVHFNWSHWWYWRRLCAAGLWQHPLDGSRFIKNRGRLVGDRDAARPAEPKQGSASRRQWTGDASLSRLYGTWKAYQMGFWYQLKLANGFTK